MRKEGINILKHKYHVRTARDILHTSCVWPFCKKFHDTDENLPSRIVRARKKRTLFPRNNENILNVCSIPLVFIVLAGVVHLDGEIARHISASFFVVLLDLLQNLPQTFQIRIRLSGVFSNQECMRFRLLTMRQGTNHLVTERCKLHRKQ